MDISISQSSVVMQIKVRCDI